MWRTRRFRWSMPMKNELKVKPFTGPAGGWGSVRSLAKSLTKEHIPVSGSRVLLHQNKTGGFMCVSCAWAKPDPPRVFEFCENGAKATTWELTGKRTPPEFFAKQLHRSRAMGRL